MLFDMYAVKDEMTNKFLNPTFIEHGEYSEPSAIRQFKSNMNSIKLWKDNPNDFSLYLVGTFDDEAGAASTALSKIIGGRSVVDD